MRLLRSCILALLLTTLIAPAWATTSRSTRHRVSSSHRSARTRHVARATPHRSSKRAAGHVARRSSPAAPVVAVRTPDVPVAIAPPAPFLRPRTWSAADPLIAVLAYHDVSSDPKRADAVTPEFLHHQITVCRRQGWAIVSANELVARRKHPDKLPRRTMVLVFDATPGFEERALPLLRAEKVPAAVVVTTSTLDHPGEARARRVGWSDVREWTKAGIGVISGSHDLARLEPMDPAGDTGPSVTTRRYRARERRYETADEYRKRIDDDLAASQRTLHTRLHERASVLAWPFGQDNESARDCAERAGFHLGLVGGDAPATPADLRAGRLPTIRVTRSMRFDESASWLRPQVWPPLRAAEVDFDELYDTTPGVFAARVDQLIRRLQSMGATDAFLTVCSDPESSGRLTGAWVMTTHAPVRADVWTHVAARLSAAGLRVWARVPSMNLTWAWDDHSDWRLGRDPLPIASLDAADPTHGASSGDAESASLDALPGVAVSAWPTRLSPELPGPRRAAADFVADLAAHAPIDGLVFDDDAFMTPVDQLASKPHAGADAKAHAIDELLAACRAGARAWRPECRFARRLDAATVEVDGVHPALAQDYERSLRDNDLTVVMAYPWMTGKDEAGDDWIERVGARAAERCGVLSVDSTAAPTAASSHVLLEIQTFDWLKASWLPGRDIGSMATAAHRAGLRNLGLCPVEPHDGEIPVRLLDAAATAPMAGADDGN